jgi:hypothetical protein
VSINVQQYIKEMDAAQGRLVERVVASFVDLTEAEDAYAQTQPGFWPVRIAVRLPGARRAFEVNVAADGVAHVVDPDSSAALTVRGFVARQLGIKLDASPWAEVAHG